MTERTVVLVLLLLTLTESKIYKKCDLARELRRVHEVNINEISVWVCIAKHESDFNTSAVNKGSGDHGLFQISDLYWCTLEGQGRACNAACSSFEDDDITDDVECIRRIFNEHKRLSGNGFNAWVVYPLYCKGNTDSYVEGCFDKTDLVTNTTVSSTTESGDDEYEFPPLPVFPKSVSPGTINVKSKIQPSQNADNLHQPEDSIFSPNVPSILRVSSSTLAIAQTVTEGPNEISHKYPFFYYSTSQATTGKSTFSTAATILRSDKKRPDFRISPVTVKNLPFTSKEINGVSKVSNKIQENVGHKEIHTIPIKSENEKESDSLRMYQKISSHFSASLSPNEALKKGKSSQSIKLGTNYTFERNRKGGFKLRLIRNIFR